MKLFKNYQNVTKMFTVILVITAIALGSYFTVLLINLFQKVPQSYLMNVGAMQFKTDIVANYYLLFNVYTGLLGFILGLICLYTLFQLRKVFMTFERQNEIFIEANVQHFKKIATFTFFWGLFYFMIKYLFPLFLLMHLEEVFERVGGFTIIFDFAEMFIFLIFIAVFLGFSEMFKRGVELKEDNEAII